MHTLFWSQAIRFAACAVVVLLPVYAFSAGSCSDASIETCTDCIARKIGAEYAPILRKDAVVRLPTYTNSIGMAFVLIPAGSFNLGMEAIEPGPYGRLFRPKILIDKAFYLGKYEVTQKQWVAVMGNNPSAFKGDNNPVDRVSWNEAQEFIKRLNQKEGHNRYRLPTEAEWEYAVRAGSSAQYFFLKKTLGAFRGFENVECPLDAYAWFKKNAGASTHPVGEKKPNPWGLYDVYGNVWEWVGEYWLKIPTARVVKPPVGLGLAVNRVARGGAWFNAAKVLNSWWRAPVPAEYQSDRIGFRLALSPE
ncbi:MAG: formylglycine-generating enzyme family protein [Burkholderiaceae bacterium]|jgi:formylglycine-generating enzyme required for sulfatase activity|nr:formylglycine-generating enzyme family protein [Burkholderiaceae bacterium]